MCLLRIRALALLLLALLLALTARLIHGLERLVQLVDGLLKLLLALLTRAALAARLTLLALLAALPLLALLTLLLLLLREPLLHLLEPLLQLLGLAAQRLLLPAVLLREPVTPVRLIRELFLAARELLELADRVVLFLLRRIERCRRFGFVLVLLEIHLELEQLAQVTAGSKDAAKADYAKVASALDRAAKSGRIHRNAANRQKSRLAKLVSA